MKMNNAKTMWAQPTIKSVERMKNAAGGSNTGLPKGPGATEFLYDGPGS